MVKAQYLLEFPTFYSWASKKKGSLFLPTLMFGESIGFIFDTYTKDTDTKQVSEVWLNEETRQIRKYVML